MGSRLKKVVSCKKLFCEVLANFDYEIQFDHTILCLLKVLKTICEILPLKVWDTLQSLI